MTNRNPPWNDYNTRNEPKHHNPQTSDFYNPHHEWPLSYSDSTTSPYLQQTSTRPAAKSSFTLPSTDNTGYSAPIPPRLKDSRRATFLSSAGTEEYDRSVWHRSQAVQPMREFDPSIHHGKSQFMPDYVDTLQSQMNLIGYAESDDDQPHRNTGQQSASKHRGDSRHASSKKEDIPRVAKPMSPYEREVADAHETLGLLDATINKELDMHHVKTIVKEYMQAFPSETERFVSAFKTICQFQKMKFGKASSYERAVHSRSVAPSSRDEGPDHRSAPRGETQDRLRKSQAPPGIRREELARDSQSFHADTTQNPRKRGPFRDSSSEDRTPPATGTSEPKPPVSPPKKRQKLLPTGTSGEGNIKSLLKKKQDLQVTTTEPVKPVENAITSGVGMVASTPDKKDSPRMAPSIDKQKTDNRPGGTTNPLIPGARTVVKPVANTPSTTFANLLAAAQGSNLQETQGKDQNVPSTSKAQSKQTPTASPPVTDPKKGTSKTTTFSTQKPSSPHDSPKKPSSASSSHAENDPRQVKKDGSGNEALASSSSPPKTRTERPASGSMLMKTSQTQPDAKSTSQATAPSSTNSKVTSSVKSTATTDGPPIAGNLSKLARLKQKRNERQNRSPDAATSPQATPTSSAAQKEKNSTTLLNSKPSVLANENTPGKPKKGAVLSIAASKPGNTTESTVVSHGTARSEGPDGVIQTQAKSSSHPTPKTTKKLNPSNPSFKATPSAPKTSPKTGIRPSTVGVQPSERELQTVYREPSEVVHLKNVLPAPIKDAEPYFEFALYEKFWSDDNGDSRVIAKEPPGYLVTSVENANHRAKDYFMETINHHCNALRVKVMNTKSTRSNVDDCMTFNATMESVDMPDRKLYLEVAIKRYFVDAATASMRPPPPDTPYIAKMMYIVNLYRLVEVPEQQEQTADRATTSSSSRSRSFSSSSSSSSSISSSGDENDSTSSMYARRHKEKLANAHKRKRRSTTSNDNDQKHTSQPLSKEPNYLRIHTRPLPSNRCEAYTTRATANAAAFAVQVDLSHDKEARGANARWQEQNVRVLREKLDALHTEEEQDDGSSHEEGKGCWRSEFNESGLGGAKFEIVVQRVGVCGPRNV
ncbi:unnamed protein product [Periconia digitata]|uniref:Uncharacterized protein n=1 Tax=Periconia digitata TaxID=1303443 RepID=A0A9W4XVD8_9PLEO|nr:unnamed protein product [Periconia digitata]